MNASAEEPSFGTNRLPPHLPRMTNDDIGIKKPMSASSVSVTSSSNLLGSLPPHPTPYHQPFSPFRPPAQSLISSNSIFSATYGGSPSTFGLPSNTTVTGSGVIKSSSGPVAGILPSLNYNRPIVRSERHEQNASVTGNGTNVQQSTVTNHVAGNQPSGTTNVPTADSCTASQKLKVEDALSYLDQVKVQFSSRPQVYSDFLDIMKDFKSQSIDTPGVIQRVSSLFRGRSNLIVGFNTFLPPGYKIKVDGDRISICTPNGDTKLINNEPPPTDKSAVSPNVNGAKPASGQQGTENQPQNLGTRPQIEFNHAISYVNKIKNRFQHNPEIYKQFLEILHSYQKEQRDLKMGSMVNKPILSESEVYQSVAKLFENEPDLLREFSQFLPDAAGPGFLSSFENHFVTAQSQASVLAEVSHEILKEPKVEPQLHSPPPPPPPPRVPSPNPPAPIQPAAANVGASGTLTLKRHAISPKHDSQSPPKKMKKQKVVLGYDIELTEAAKYGTIEEFQFFDKVRKAFKCDEVYDNFLRCLVLYNKDLVSKAELIDLLYPFLGRFPDLMRWLKNFMGCNDRTDYVDTVSVKVEEQERICSDLAMEIDYASCKRLGVSYRALPKSFQQPYCSGKSELCEEVINTTWVSFPSWASEDSSYVASKKTQYEEFLYRTEDERFELSIVIDTNASAIYTLESVQRKLSRMRADDAKKFLLDDSVGGRSAALMYRAIKRIYGDKATDIIDGLKRNPSVAVPLVLKRLKAKDEEWREAQKGFNKIWREQYEKYHLKSLDHQGITFKQNDLKQVRSKVLLNQIETLYDERREKIDEGTETDLLNGPHMQLKYPNDRNIIYDVADLLIHHVRRQTSIQKEEKSRIKRVLRQFLPELFGLEKEALSDDDDESSSANEAEKPAAENGDKESGPQMVLRRSNRVTNDNDKQSTMTQNLADLKQRAEPKVSCGYTLIYVPNSWYVFLRLHNMMCERLNSLKRHAQELKSEKEKEKKRKMNGDKQEQSAAEALRVNQKETIPPDHFYAHLIAETKNLLDGQIDNCQYEDAIREMFTINAYTAFTMDKLVQTMVRQLQHMVTDDLSIRCTNLYEKSKASGGAGGYTWLSNGRQEQEELYQTQAEQIMSDNNCFKIYLLNEDGRITFELLDTDSVEDEEEGKNDWSAYIQSLLDLIKVEEDGKQSQPLLQALDIKPIYLVRNLRQVRPKSKLVNKEAESTDSASQTTEESVETNGSSEGEQPEPSTSGTSISENDPNMIIHESLEVQLTPGHYKMKFVAGTTDVMYKKGAPAKAKIKHEIASKRRLKRFEKWALQKSKDHKTDFADATNWLAGIGAEIRSKPEEKRHSEHFPYLKYKVWKSDFSRRTVR